MLTQCHNLLHVMYIRRHLKEKCSVYKILQKNMNLETLLCLYFTFSKRKRFVWASSQLIGWLRLLVKMVAQICLKKWAKLTLIYSENSQPKSKRFESKKIVSQVLEIAPYKSRTSLAQRVSFDFLLKT